MHPLYHFIERRFDEIYVRLVALRRGPMDVDSKRGAAYVDIARH